MSEDGHDATTTYKDTQIQIALEELRLLQGVIGQQDELASRFIRWAGTILLALAAFYLQPLSEGAASGAGETSRIGPWTFFLLSTGVIVLLAWMSAIFRLAEHRAIDRAAEVEKFLRRPKKLEYDGPLIGKSLDETNCPKEQFKIVWTARISGPFLLLEMVAAGIAIFT